MGADRFTHFLQDRRRALLERYRAAENLADGIEEVDLLVAFRELVRGVLHLHRVLEELREDGTQELEIAVQLHSLDGTRTECDPRSARSAHGDDEHPSAFSNLVVFVVSFTQP